jgi:hypothetical protein
MLSPQELEQMIQDTGGVAVVVGVVSTWGHLLSAGGGEMDFGAVGGRTSEGGTPPDARVVSIAAGIGATPVEGGQITVDGVVEEVRAIRSNARGTKLLMLLANRSHVVSVYRAIPTGVEDDFGTPETTWTLVAADVGADLEPRSGGIEQGEVGRTVEARWSGMFPPILELRVDDAVVVTSGPGPTRFLVSSILPHGEHWDLRADLDVTTEVIP